MKTIRRFWLTVAYLAGAHLLALLMLGAVRGVQYLALRKMIQPDTDGHVGGAMLRGVWFDNVVGCYILVVPLVVVLVAACCNGYGRGWRRFAGWFCGVLTVLALAVSAANIPYFAYFFRPINSSIYNWFGYADTTLGMLVGETSYLAYFALFAVVAAVYVGLLVWLRRCTDRRMQQLPADPQGLRPTGLKVLVAVCLTGLCIFGIRGRMGYNPIKVSQAYYCSDPMLNQLGITPAYNLITSTLDDLRPENEELHLMPYAQAVALSRRYLGLTGAADSLHPLRSPLPPAAEGASGRKNVVVILMESMSASFLHSPGPLTPTLDSLYRTSLAFSHFYSAGIHTNHGITASLYAFPAMMKRNLMKGTVTPHRTGLPTRLHDAGYHNMFFMTHEAQYDNMNAFLLTNGYDDVYAQEDYPASEVVNAFGVPDDYLFRYALPVLNRVASEGRPFMATLLTVSNHPPYVLPDGFRSHSTDDELRIVEYADRSIGRFLRQASQQPWYKETVFVLLGDHGKLVGGVDTELPESYNHIPLIIFGPGITPQRYDGLATQADLTPTLLGLMGLGWDDYEGFGIDVLRQEHPMVFYTADEQIVARDAARLYVYKPATRQTFCYRKTAAGTLTADPDTARYADLRQYAFAMLQTAEYMEQKRK